MTRLNIHIWHGSYNVSKVITGKDIKDCLTIASDLNTYVPNPTEPAFPKVLASLEATRKASMGWVDYSIIE